MADHLALLGQLCAPGGVGLPLGLLLAGLTGSIFHCAPMCGPFVLGQVSDRLAGIPATRLCEMSRLRAGVLWPYHAGRLMTYAGLGAVAATVGALPGMRPLSGALLGLAALLFLRHAAVRLFPVLRRLVPGLDRAPAWWGRRVGGLSRGIDRTSWRGGLMLGVTLGFLPCGLLYAALAAAASTGATEAGALAMLAFGLGTVPSLVAVGIAGGAAAGHWHRAVGAAAPVLMLANSVLLAVMAWRLMAGA
jgi:sulfite exporter TauE/SafE